MFRKITQRLFSRKKLTEKLKEKPKNNKTKSTNSDTKRIIFKVRKEAINSPGTNQATRRSITVNTYETYGKEMIHVNFGFKFSGVDVVDPITKRTSRKYLNNLERTTNFYEKGKLLR